MKATWIISLLSVVLFAGCKKEDEQPEAPVITYIGISATEVTAFNNELQITFSYEDFQGDLGNDNPDIYELRVKDDRLGDYDWYHVPPMTPNNEELHIKGEYVLTIDPLFLMGNGSSETTKFTLQIKDRAGNWSNQIVTAQVTITP